MAKGYFPTALERQKLINALKESGVAYSSPKLYHAYLNAVTKLDQEMDRLYTLDRYGAPPNVSAEDRRKLLTLLENVGTAGEAFLGDAQEKNANLEAGVPGMVNQLQGMFALDYNAISAYDPRERARPLIGIQADVRTQTIDLRDRNISTMGNAQSSRIPVTIYGVGGKLRSGMFTKASTVRVRSQFQEFLTQAGTYCDEAGKQALGQLIGKARDYFVKNNYLNYDDTPFRADASDDLVVGRILLDLQEMRKNRGSRLTTDRDLMQLCKTVGLNPKDISPNAHQILANGANEMLSKAGTLINSVGLQLEEGDRLDCRNTAMSAVADLLGVSSVLARSENMRCINERGETIEGTFMEYAKGLDLEAEPELCCHLKGNPVEDDGPRAKAYRSIADLQVLDMLCLNVDRHQGNMMYRVDKKGRFIGVQGFDNDSSFGGRTPKPDAIERMRIISAGMYQRLKAVTPAMLKFTLRGRGLSEKQIQCAAKTLDMIKQAVADKKLRVVQDKEFKTLDFTTDLCPTESGQKNLFTKACYRVATRAKLRTDNMIPFEPYEESDGPLLSKVSSTERRYTVGGLLDASERVGRLIRNPETNFNVDDLTGIRGSSENFKQMVESARMVAHLPRYLYQIDPENNPLNLPQTNPYLLQDDSRVRDTVKAIDQVYRNLELKTLKYLEDKKDARHAASIETLKGKNPYEQRRIDYARNLLNEVREYQRLRAGPVTEAEKEEYRAITERRALGEHIKLREQVEAIQNEQPQPEAEPQRLPQAEAESQQQLQPDAESQRQPQPAAQPGPSPS